MRDSERFYSDDSLEGMAGRLRRARGEAKVETAAEAARALGIPLPTYTGHENGSRGFKKEARRYADFFRVNLEWLLTGRGTMRRQGVVLVTGTIGRGGEIFPYGDIPPRGGIAHVAVSSAVTEGDIATEIEGDHLYPFKEGWKLIWNPNVEGVPDDAINRLCAVRIADEGGMLVKTVRRGRTPETYTLESWNAPPRDDVRLDWASPIKMIVAT